MTDAPAKGPDEKFCSECAAVISSRAEICPKCGVRQMAPPASISLGATTPNGKSRVSAAILAFFLGGLGVHKFYLGQVGWGVIYLLFCWTFIPSIVAFVEFILLLTMSDEYFNHRFGRS
ncbi:NINE protein [Sinimarinibacterium sp. CAU 1509]|uniref:NINE protein n=1 Tax=Sinimarinibacterium sp. CAU 1509 TaxID=2562283 RepID=UPI0010AD8B38|nr:NINE protein [Sinimarinibacterium sp. CAU 1509]TJY57215.1 NINE protein [Sinimarinibacterium sp. CAU 1509]